MLSVCIVLTLSLSCIVLCVRCRWAAVVPVSLLYNGPLRDLYALLLAKHNLVYEEFFKLEQPIREQLQRNPFAMGELGADGMKEFGMKVKITPFDAADQATIVVKAGKDAEDKEKLTAVDAG